MEREAGRKNSFVEKARTAWLVGKSEFRYRFKRDKEFFPESGRPPTEGGFLTRIGKEKPSPDLMALITSLYWGTKNLSTSTVSTLVDKLAENGSLAEDERKILEESRIATVLPGTYDWRLKEENQLQLKINVDNEAVSSYLRNNTKNIKALLVFFDGKHAQHGKTKRVKTGVDSSLTFNFNKIKEIPLPFPIYNNDLPFGPYGNTELFIHIKDGAGRARRMNFILFYLDNQQASMKSEL